MSAKLYEQCESALRALETCIEREVATYGKQGYQEVKKMEHEAPAPSPCVDAFNAVIEALSQYDGDLSDVDLGRHKDAIHATLKARRGKHKAS